MDNQKRESSIEIEDLGIIDTAGFKNLLAIREYTMQTRSLFRTSENRVEILQNQVNQQNLVIAELKKQIQNLQVKLYTKNVT